MASTVSSTDRHGKLLRYTPEIKQLIILYSDRGMNFSAISKMLLNRHGVACSRNGVRRFLKRYRLTGCLNRIYRKRAEEKKKVTDGHKQFINMWMRHNPETTARCLRDRLKSVFNLSVSVSCVSRIRKNIGWTVKHTGYCQLISAANCLKREQWCLSALKSKDTFENVIFVDETTIEMSSAGRLQFYRAQSTTDKLPYKAPKPKHAYKVHLWGGISYRGRTDLCVFTGIMDSVIYQQILERNFLPFVDKKFPDGFRLYQDNDSKHVSKSTKEWMAQKNIAHCVMEVPASSPDLNPIENLWSTLKDYLQRIIKPRKKDELVNGIKVFWNSLTAEQCCSYIDHIHKVIPEVAINRGGPTQY